MNPKIKFTIDIKEDTENAIDFVRRHAADTKLDKKFLKWFLPEEVQYILNSKFSKKEKEKILINYTESIYNLRQKEIKDGFEKVKKDWGKVEKDYFKIVDRVFNKYPWPKGDYIGFASIFNMYPRNIIKKTFYFPYIHNISYYANKVIAHEMLHFIFFDYINKHYKLKEDFEFKNKTKRYLWEVSEVFNNVIENWEPYKQILKTNFRLYPGTEKMFKKMQSQWQKKQDIDWLLDKWLKV